MLPTLAILMILLESSFDFLLLLHCKAPQSMQQNRSASIARFMQQKWSNDCCMRQQIAGEGSGREEKRK